MCGLCGVAYADPSRPPAPDELAAMMPELRHRGPDDEGTALLPGVALGHTRLSILDLSPAGRQPLANEDGTIHLAFNGEIYNHVELRRDLEGRGHRFRSRTDSEVLVHLYEERGADLVHDLRGMFAFALWDARTATLLLARDRLGKKPLCWTVAGGALLFASELAALVTHPRVSRAVDPVAVGHYLAYQYVPAPRTAFAGVQHLQAGHLLTWRAGALSVRRYWHPSRATGDLETLVHRAMATGGLERGLPGLGPRAIERGLPGLRPTATGDLEGGLPGLEPPETGDLGCGPPGLEPPATGDLGGGPPGLRPPATGDLGGGLPGLGPPATGDLEGQLQGLGPRATEDLVGGLQGLASRATGDLEGAVPGRRPRANDGVEGRLHDLAPWATDDLEGALPGRRPRAAGNLEGALPGLRPRATGDLEARLQDLLEESVRLRMRSDVPVGAFLSGGLDSSLVVALMARHGPVRTFSVGFAEAAWDELPHARLVSRHFGTEHHELVVRPEAASLLPSLVRRYGQPFADTAALPTWYLSRHASSSVKVALTGDGGDEAFAGYRRYRAVLLGSLLRRLRVPWPRSLVAGDLVERYGRRVWAFPPSPASRALLAGWLDVPGGVLDRVVAADLAGYLPDDLLVKTDIASMAHGLELRSPLLDHHVVEFGLALPPWQRVRGPVGKWLLRRVARRLLPPAVLRRPKTSFEVPVSAWLRGPLRPMLEDLVASLAGRGYLPAGVPARLVREHLAGTDHGQKLWMLLILELWHREFGV